MSKRSSSLTHKYVIWFYHCDSENDFSSTPIVCATLTYAKKHAQKTALGRCYQITKERDRADGAIECEVVFTKIF